MASVAIMDLSQMLSVVNTIGILFLFMNLCPNTVYPVLGNCQLDEKEGSSKVLAQSPYAAAKDISLISPGSMYSNLVIRRVMQAV